MARGRMLNKSISSDKAVDNLSDDTSRLLFTWLIAHLDVNGCFYGEAVMIKSLVFPRRADVTIDRVELYLQEMERFNLIAFYEVNGERLLFCPAFDKNQVGLRKEREAPDFPPPPGYTPQALENDDGYLPDDCRIDAANLPDDCRIDAANNPAEVKVNINKENRNKREVEGENMRVADAPTPPASSPSISGQQSKSKKQNRKPHSEAALYLENRGHVRLRDVQCEEIDKNVIEPEDLEDWKESVDAWLLSSSRNPTNVVGILDWFREGIPDHARPGYKPGKPGNNGYGPQNDTRTDPSKYARGIPENLQAKPKPKELTPADEAWNRVCVELRGQLTKATYAANVEPLTAVGLEGGVLSIRAPTEIVERIHDRFGVVFERTAKQAGLSQIVIS